MARVVLPVAGAIIGGIYGNPQLGWAIGSAIAGVVDPQVIQGPKIGDVARQTSQEGGPRPIFFALSQPFGGNIIATSEPVIVKGSEGGKGGPKTKTESVYRTYAAGVGEGPISAFYRAWRNGILVYNADDGSSESNLKFLENARFFLGSWTQNASPDLEPLYGVGTTPTHRGTAYMVMANEDLTDLRGSIPQWTFQVERCPIGLVAENVVCDVGLTWTEYEGADSYRLYRISAEGTQIAYEGTDLDFLDEDAEEETPYRYFVRPIVNDAEVSQSNVVSITTAECTPEGTVLSAGKHEPFPGSIYMGFKSPECNSVFSGTGWGGYSPVAYYKAGPSNPPLFIQGMYWTNSSTTIGEMWLVITTSLDALGVDPGSTVSFRYVDNGGTTRTFNNATAASTGLIGNGYGSGTARYWKWTMPNTGPGAPILSARFSEGVDYDINYFPPDDPP